jgi:hypothetical protein
VPEVAFFRSEVEPFLKRVAIIGTAVDGAFDAYEDRALPVDKQGFDPLRKRVEQGRGTVLAFAGVQ